MNIKEKIGRSNVLLITLDTLRYDVAQDLFLKGKLPNFGKLLPDSGWEKRHAPGSFTYASHHAIFSGFFPTPVNNPLATRLFASSFAGSTSTGSSTFQFSEATLIEALENRGYHTACIGGVGFFNKQSPLGMVFPSMFKESYWEEKMGVTNPQSTFYQFSKAKEIIENRKGEQYFLFINVSAMHQPNCFYLEGVTKDSIESHGAALQYVDSQLPILFDALSNSNETIVLVMSDHGTTYGEDGYTGHRLAHESVWTVPYLQTLWCDK